MQPLKLLPMSSAGRADGGGQRRSSVLLALLVTVFTSSALAAVRTETFDREPPHWEGINHRNTFFEPKTVSQDFGYSPATRQAGGQRGEVGGRINPAGEVAYYGFRLPKPLTLDSPLSAEGRLLVKAGAGHCLLGFFHANTLGGWRTPNTLVARLNGRGETFHCHLEYATGRWRAGAGVIGEIVPGERLLPAELPCDQVCHWKLTFDPQGAEGRGLVTLVLDGKSAQCEIGPEHRSDGLTLTHFGLLPVLKAWDDPGEIWIDDLSVNGIAFDFSTDPQWDALSNRVTFVTTDTRPKFDFGWSPTRHAGGKESGELGGLIFRGDCREPQRLASYGDRLETLTLDVPFEARGKVTMLRGVSDSTASIGFYHSEQSLRSNPSQRHATPMNFLGINIEGPSSEGFFFYPVYRTQGDAANALGADGGKAPRIHPDGRVREWFLRYDPAGADGRGRITVGLDGQTCILDLEPGHKEMGASFNRFGICTPWIDGNSVTVYFDDLTYTCSP